MTGGSRELSGREASNAAPSMALGGDLASMSLFDIAQMLVLCGRTGELVVRHEGHRGTFYLRDGAILSVVDDRGHEGMAAAVGILLWETGTFEFVTRPVRIETAIEERADAFLLEAARQVDEFRERRAAAASGGEDVAEDLSEEASLILKRRAMERLKELFTHVTSDSGMPRTGSAALDLGVLRAEPARLGVDAVYLRPGQRAMARRGRRLVPLWPEAVSADHLERWLRDVAPAHRLVELEPGGDDVRFVADAEDGSQLEVAIAHEATQLSAVVRVVTAEIETPESFGIDDCHLVPLLRRGRGLVVLAGARGRGRARAFAALTGLVARERRGLLVTLERRRHCLLERAGLDSEGVAVFQRGVAGPAELEAGLEFARAEEADVVAVDPLSGPVVDELENAAWPLVVVGTVVARGAVAGLRAVRRMLGALDDRSAAGWLERHLLAVVATGHLAVDGGYRPVAEVLSVDATVSRMLIEGGGEELERSFAAGRLAGSVSLAQLAARLTTEDGRAAA